MIPSEFYGMPVITDKYAPAGKAFILNGAQVVVLQQVKRTRWWWKPWTWRRPAYTPLTLAEMWPELVAPAAPIPEMVGLFKGYHPTLTYFDEVADFGDDEFDAAEAAFEHRYDKRYEEWHDMGGDA